MIEKKVKGATINLKKEGIFDLDSLYSSLKAWFDDHKYDFNETTHQTKNTQKGKAIKYVWKAEREATTYILFVVDVTFIVMEFSQKGGKSSGKIELKIESNLELDPKGNWEDTAAKNIFFKIYNNLINNNEIGAFKKKLIGEVNDLIKLAKQDLDLET